MPLQFYKPNAKITGSAVSVSFNSKDEAMYIQFIKQVGYNTEKKLGSFKGGDKANFKFSLTEVGGMIDALERNVACPMYHGVGSNSARINFQPYIAKDGDQKGFSLSITKVVEGQNDIYRIGFTFPEMRLLKEYLQFILDHCFSAIYSADKKKFEELKKKKESLPVEEEIQPNQEAPDPWKGEESPDDDF